ncbi:MAG: IS200/IS605 family transposase [Bacteroidota bacterium]|nr:IS200/IS605 family transposase [Bacteroidota bacterium]MDP4230948.1 IS200/IS605 family transposase [Bacteroidota bacterium]MDP4236938.1 IS200/IS605 family transposase [Bacteroidota bacterium]
MAHTYISNYQHFVFSTKHRQKSLTPEIRERLWAYMGGIARNKNIVPIEIGGYDDHCHALLLLPATITLAKTAQVIKGVSSKWLSETYPELSSFRWQDAYGAFSVSVSQVDRTIAYIKNQEQHHKRLTFQEEYVSFLKKHNIEYDERYVWG